MRDREASCELEYPSTITKIITLLRYSDSLANLVGSRPVQSEGSEGLTCLQHVSL